MTFTRPTLTDLIARVEADINTRLPGGDSRVRRSFLGVMARTLSGLAHGLYGYLDWISKQVFPDTAEAENMERWANIWGITRKASVKATGTVTCTGTDGASIDTGLILRTSDEIEIITTSSGIIAGGTLVLNVEAVDPGELGNLETGTVVTFVSPLGGVDADALTGALTGGEDTESDILLRGRLLDRLQEPPMGGAERDYIKWAKEVAGVTRAWVFPEEDGAGSVRVRFMMDDTYSDGVPLAGDVTTVDAYISIKRPVTAELFVSAPTAVPLDFDITLKDESGATINTPSIVAQVTAELTDMIRRDAIPGGKILISHVKEAVSIAAGEFDHVMIAPTANVTHTVGQIATPGTFTFTAP